MKRNNNGNFLAVLILFVMSTLLLLICGSNAPAQKSQTAVQTLV